jgi:branched-chain amino acid transport system ATP-binding protein
MIHDASNLLEVKGLSFGYGGLQILSGMSFGLKPGEKVGLIGPNGAGKTTLLNIISGILHPLRGEVYISGNEISRLPPHKRVSLGLGRCFQANELFLELNLLENVLIALKGVEVSGFQMIRPLSSYKNRIRRAQELLESIGLWGKRLLLPTQLSHGENRLMEILLATANEPKVLLMDEPSAGLTREETFELASSLTNMMRDRTVLFSAHDLDFVFQVAERVIVLYYGSVFQQGTAREIAANAKVKEIYLGI